MWKFSIMVDSTDTVVDWSRDWGSDVEVNCPLDDLVAKGETHNRVVEIAPRSSIALVTVKTHVAAVAFQLRFCEEIADYKSAAHSGLNDPSEFEIVIGEIIKSVEYDLLNNPSRMAFGINVRRASIQYDYVAPIPFIHISKNFRYV